MADSGMEWIGLNTRDYPPEEWNTVRVRAAAAGVRCMPWGRLGVPDAGETRDDCLRVLEDLYEVCESWDTTCIPNVEDEFKEILPPAELAPYIDGRVEGLSTVAWLYNDPDFSSLTGLPVLLQLFATDMRIDPTSLEQTQRACVRHARAKGFTYVGVTFQTYGAAHLKKRHPRKLGLAFSHRGQGAVPIRVPNFLDLHIPTEHTHGA